MDYYRLSPPFLQGLNPAGKDTVLLEVLCGTVEREIGLRQEEVVYAVPTRRHTHSSFEMTPIEFSPDSPYSISKEEFERYWTLVEQREAIEGAEAPSGFWRRLWRGLRGTG